MSRRCSRSTTAGCSISCRRGHPTLQSARRSWPPIRRACTASQDRGLEAKAVIVRCGAGNWRRRRATTAHLGAAVGCGTTCGWGGNSMTWYRSISGVERRTFWACFGGWSLDALDLQMFSLVIPAIIATWHLSKTEAGLIGSVTLVAASLGGWLGGALADRIGRVKALQI